MVKITNLHDSNANHNKDNQLVMIKINIKDVEIPILEEINKVEMLIPWIKILMVNNTFIM